MSRAARNKPREKRRAPARWLRRVLLVGMLGILLAVGGWHLLTWLALRAVPMRVTPASYALMVPEVSRLYTADGTLLYEFGEERRTWVPLEEISPHLVDAVIAVEDKDFRGHAGVSWYAIVRAAVANIRAGRFAQGGSTITQQMARGLFLTPRKTLWRKFCEAVLAQRLEQELTKDEILEIYLNQIYWGHGAYGAEEAARTYFCKHAAALDRSEATLLAAIISAPERFSPRKDPAKARERFEHARRRLDEEDLPYPGATPCRRHHMDLAPHTAVRIRTWLERLLGEDEFMRGGHTVQLTLDARVQAALTAGVRRFLEDQGPDGTAWPRFRIRADAPRTVDDCLIPSGRPLWVRVEGSDEDGCFPVTCRDRHGALPREAMELDLPGHRAPALAPGDWIQVTPAEKLDLCSSWEGDPPLFVPMASPQLATVALDSRNGEVLGSVGGFGNRYHPFDRAFDARRTLGSTVKPFVYLSALERWGWTDDTLLPEDLPQRFRGAEGRPWIPAEPHPLPANEEATVRTALVHSLNRPVVGILARLGLSAFNEDWARYGGPEVPMEDLSVALGNVELSPAQIAGLYALFPGDGAAWRPRLVRTVTDRNKEVIYAAEDGPPATADRSATRALARALRAVTEEGTGRRAVPRSLRARPGLARGGKTGTTKEARDSWFVGWAGHIVVAVWLGNDDNTPVKGASGPRLAAPLWSDIVDEMLKAGVFE